LWQNCGRNHRNEIFHPFSISHHSHAISHEGLVPLISVFTGGTIRAEVGGRGGIGGGADGPESIPSCKWKFIYFLKT
jgi:hypothetical protein